MAAAQPHIETAKQYTGIGQPTGVATGPPSTDVPATTAPLEAGPHTVSGPYPTTATEGAPNNLKVGE
jgi:hypothetical protein